MKYFFRVCRTLGYWAVVFAGFICALIMITQGEYFKGGVMLAAAIVLIIDAKEK